MKKLATSLVAIAGFIGTSAFAADMGVPAAPPPAPVWNWTGWYVGVPLAAVPVWLCPTRSPPTDSLVGVRSAIITSSRRFGSWDLRPTFKGRSKKIAIL